MVLLGALLADMPYTRPLPVSGSAYDTDAGRAVRARPDPVRGADRHRRRAAGRLLQAELDAVSFWVPCRTTVATRPPEGDAGAAAPGRGGARPARCPLGELPGRPRSGRQRSPRWPSRTPRARRVRARAGGARRRRGRHLRGHLEDRRRRASPRSSSATCAGVDREASAVCEIHLSRSAGASSTGSTSTRGADPARSQACDSCPDMWPIRPVSSS